MSITARRMSRGGILPPANITFTPAVLAYSSSEVVNSGRGQYEWLEQPSDPAGWPLVDCYLRDQIAWKNLEPSQGVYSFESIDTALAKAESMGGRLGFRVMPYYAPGSEPLAPSWIPTAAGYDCPDWNSPEYISSWTNLISAIGAQYNSDKRLFFMDISGFGCWGEWYWEESYGPMISDTNAHAIISAAINAFPDRYVLAPAFRPYIDWAVTESPRVGHRFDFLGGMDISYENAPPLNDVWKRAPAVAEWGNSAGVTMAKGLENVRTMHFSMLSSANKPMPYADLSPNEQIAFLQANKESGFRYSLDSLDMTTNVRAGTSQVVTTIWTNHNVAPTYDSWQVSVILSANDITHSLPLNDDLRLITGGNDVVSRSFSTSITIPAIASGVYQVGIVVTDKNYYLSPMRLAIENQTSDGICWLGSINIV